MYALWTFKQQWALKMLKGHCEVQGEGAKAWARGDGFYMASVGNWGPLSVCPYEQTDWQTHITENIPATSFTDGNKTEL